MKRFIKNVAEPTLRPCPFCGNKPSQDGRGGRGIIIQVYESTLYGIGEPSQYAVVKCGECLAELKRATVEYAVKAWNTRA